MSLADELLADLNELGDEELSDSDMDDSDESDLEKKALEMATNQAEEEEEDDEMETEKDGVKSGLDSLSERDLNKVAKLHSSKGFQECLKKIDEFISHPVNDFSGALEHHPEYKLIVQANKLAVDVDNEIVAVHKYIRDIYSSRFPELESLVQNPLDYAMAVKTIKNETDLTKLDLSSFLAAATVMVVTVTSTTTSGQPLPDEELQKSLKGCDMILSLDQSKKKMLSYVETRMNFVAPNLTIILGSTVAAKLMATAGGITSLSKMPACNVLVLGSIKKNLSGFSSISVNLHAGHIFTCELIQTTPPELRRKVARLVAGKCTLAARVDSFHESSNGETGRKFLEEIKRKIDKFQELPEGKKVKALAAPDEHHRKKRGGRRARKMKEKFAMTDFKKLQNRVSFNNPEEETIFGDSVRGKGMMNQTGKVRALAVDNRTKVTAKKNAGVTKKYGSSSSSVSGLASSVIFTPVNGFEISNPEAVAAAQKERVKEANQKWFGNTEFVKVKKDSK